MKYAPRILTCLTLLALVALFLGACGGGDDNPCSGLGDGLHGDTLCRHGSGEGPTGIFAVNGGFDVQVIGGNIGSDNTTIRIYQQEGTETSLNTHLVGTTGPKAVVSGIQVRPGDKVDVHFDFGPGEFYLVIDTDATNSWTAIVSPVEGLPAG